MEPVIAFNTSLDPGTITLVALVKSAVDSGIAFANAVVSERHLMEQLEFELNPEPVRILIRVARLEAVEAEDKFSAAIEGLRRMRQDEEIQEINDEVTSRTEYVRLNPAIRYPKAITF